MRLKHRQHRVLFRRTFASVLLGIVGVFSILGFSLFRAPATAAAATNSTINFQARLLNSSGAIVPDGNYNVEFKLYNAATSSGSSQGSCTGDSACLWTETRTGTNQVTVKAGYLSVQLGSVTPFPNTINWDQSLWLTMNIGGTGTPTWDGEMNPRLAVTSVPYAFRAGQLAQFNNTTAFTSTLSIQAPTGGNQTFQIPDQGAAGTYNLLTQNQADSSYLQLQGSSPGTAQTGNFNVTGTGIAGTFNATTGINTGSGTGTQRLDASGNLLNIGNIGGTGTLQLSGTTGSSYIMSALGLGTTSPQSGSVLTIANGGWISGVNAAGTGYVNMFQLNTNNEIQVGAALNIDGGITLPTDGGQLTFSDLPIDSSAAANTPESYTFRVGSTNALTVYGEADGSGNAQNVRVAIGSSISPAYTLDVGGDVNTTGSYRINGTQICTSSGCTAASGSGSYIQNGTATQTGASFNIQPASGNVGGVIESNGTSDLLDFQNSSGNILDKVNSNGDVQIGGINSASSTTALQIQNAGGASILNIDTTGNGNLTIGNASNPATITIVGGATSSRPASPTKGQLYFDTSTNQLIQYNGTKWVSAPRTSTVIVAASNSTQTEKDAADYIATGSADQTVIQNAINTLPATGGTVYLMEGTYSFTGSLALPSNTTLSGSGKSTIIQVAASVSSNILGILTNSNQSGGNSNITIKNLTLDGNKSSVAGGNQEGVGFVKVGSGSGATAVIGATIENVTAQNFNDAGFDIETSANSNFYSVSALNSGYYGVYLYQTTNSNFSALSIDNSTDYGMVYNTGSQYNTLTNSDFYSNGSSLYINDSYNKFVGNTFSSTTYDYGIDVTGGSYLDFSHNTITSSSNYGLMLNHGTSNDTIDGNTFTGSSSSGIVVNLSSNNDVISGNTISNNGGGIFINGNGAFDITVSGNTIDNNSGNGIGLNGNSNDIVSNTIYNNSASGIAVASPASGNAISANYITTTGSNFAISLQAGSSNTRLTNNTMVGTNGIQDNATNTIYDNQINSSGSIALSGGAGLGLNTLNPVTSLENAGSFLNVQLSTPAAPLVTANGTTGTTTWGYKVTATDGLGETLASTETQITNGNSVLSSSNYNTIVPVRVSGAISYKIYRTTAGGTPSTTGYIGTLAAGASTFSFKDTGLSASGTTPTSNTTGVLDVNGTGLFQSATNSMTAFQVQNSTGSSLLNVDTNNNRVGVASLATPGTLTLSTATTGGSLPASTAYSFQVTAIDAAGGETAPSPQNTITTGTGSTNKITVSWSAVSGAVSYRVYYGTSGLETNYYTTTATSYTLTTTGGTAATPPSESSAYADRFTSTGSATFQTLTNSTSAYQFQNAAGTSALTVDTSNVRVDIGTLGTATAQLYVSGSEPSSASASLALSNAAWVSIVGNYAYTLSNDGLRIYGLTNPASPVLLSTTTLSGGGGMAVSGHYVYVGSEVIDVTNPASPVVVSSNDGITSTLMSPGNTLAAHGGYLYDMNYWNGLQVYSIANPTSPKLVGGLSTANNGEYGQGGLTVSGEYAYMVSYGAGPLEIVNISNPANPTLTDSMTVPFTNWNTITVSGRYAYLVGASLVDTIDISNPSSASIVSSLNVGSYPQNLVVQGNRGYLYNNGSNILQYLNLSNPGSPSLISGSTNVVSSASDGGDVAVRGRYAYIVGGGSSAMGVYDLGGEYAQQLQVGGTETGTLQVDGTASVGGNANVQGDLTVGSNTELQGNLGVAGQVLFENQTNSVSALQIQNASSESLLNVDTNNTILTLAGGSETISGLVVPVNLSVSAGANTGGSLSGASSTNYYYKVTAVNASGETMASPEASINGKSFTVINQPSPTVTTATTGGTLPAATYNYQVAATTSNGTTYAGSASPVTTTGSTSVNTLSWSSITGATGYSIYRSTDGGTTWYINTVSSATTSITDNGSSYTWATTATLPPYPGTATTNTNEASLAWNAVPGATSYNVYRGTTSGAEKYLANVATNSYTDTGSGTTSTTVPTIDTTARVGIGTTSPAYNLDIQGTSGARIKTTTNTTTAFQVQNASGSNVLGVDTTNLRVNVGSLGTATGQLYVGGNIPSSAIGQVNAGSPFSIFTQGNYAYVGNSSPDALDIYDVSNPASPVLTGSINTTGIPLSVYVQGHYAYATNNSHGTLDIYDVSNPASPTLADSISTGAGSDPNHIYVQGHYAYVTDGNGVLDILDISNPASPTLADSISTGAGSDPQMVYVQGSYAYVGDQQQNKLDIYNISNPASPALAGSISLTNYPIALYVQGRYAYVTTDGGYLRILDISNPASPSLLSSASTTYAANDLYVQGRYAYVATGVDYIRVYNISSPASPSLAGSINVGGNDFLYKISVQGRYAYVINFSTNQLQIFDLGGAYVQQLQAGGTETGTLQVDSNANVSGDANIQGGLTVGSSAELNGSLGVGGSAVFEDQNNSSAAFQIQNAAGGSLLNVDTSNTSVSLVSASETISGMAAPANLKVTAGPNAGGSLSGSSSTNYYYKITAVNASGQTIPSSESSINGQSFTPLNLSAPPTLTTSSTGGTLAAASYYYSVAATTANGTSLPSYSNPFNVTTTGSTSVNTLSWPAVSGATGYNIYRSTNNSTWYVNSVTSGTTSITDDGSSYTWTTGATPPSTNTATTDTNESNLTWNAVPGATSYNVYRGTTSGAEKYLANSTTTTYTDTGSATTATSLPTVNTTASVGIGTSSPVYNLDIQGTSGERIQTTANTTTAFQVQSAAGSNLLSADTTNMRIGVDVTYSQMTVPTGLTVTASGAGSGSLINSDTYSYEVTAIDGQGGETPPSSEVTATATATGSLDLAWTAVPGASGYKIYRTAANGATGTEVYLTTVLANSYTDDGSVTAGTLIPPTSNSAYIATNVANPNGTTNQLTIGGMGTPTGQLYIGGVQPKLVGDINGNDVDTGLRVVSGNFSYSSNNQDALTIVNISNPSSPKVLSSNGGCDQSHSLALAGHYIYGAGGYGGSFMVVDVSNPTSPVTVSCISVPAFSFSTENVVISGKYAYVTASDSIYVIDVSNPAHPSIVSIVPVGDGTNSNYIKISGSYAYISDSNNELIIYSLANPTIPTKVSTLTLGNNLGQIDVKGSYVYVPSQYDEKLYIVDVANPSNPTIVGTGADTFAGPVAVTVQGRYAYVMDAAFDSGNLVTFDISNPQNPTEVDGLQVTTLQNPIPDIFVQGRYAYTGQDNLLIYDLGGTYSQQLQAGGTETGTLQVDNNAQVAGNANVQGGLAVGGNTDLQGGVGIGGGLNVQGTANFAGGNNQLSAPSTPTVTPTGTAGTSSYSYTITAVNAYGGETTASPAGSTTTGNATLSATNYNAISWAAVTGATSYKVYRTVAGGASPTTTGLIGTTTTTSFNDTGLDGDGSTSPTANATGQLTVEGSTTIQTTTNTTSAFQVQDAAGANVMSVDTTNQRVSIGSGGTPTGQLYVSGNVPGNTLVGSTSLVNSPSGNVASQGNYVYILDSSNLLEVYNVGNPQAPTMVSDINVGENAQIHISGKYLYIFGGSTMKIVDISNPANPVVVSTTTVKGSFSTFRVQGHYLYGIYNSYPVGNYLVIFDVSNPMKPVQEGEAITPANWMDLAVKGDYAYVVEGNSPDLLVYNIANPLSPFLVTNTYTTGPGGGCGGGQLFTAQIEGNYLYAKNGNDGVSLKVFDISNPNQPNLIGCAGDSNNDNGPYGTPMFVDGQNLILSENNVTSGGYLEEFNIADPTAVQLSSAVNFSGPVAGVNGRYLYAVNRATSALQIFDLGGTYTQALQAGSAEISSLQVDGNANVSGNTNLQGAVMIGGSTYLQSNLNVAGQALFENSSNSASAFQVQDAAGSGLLNVDTTNGIVGVGSLTTPTGLSIAAGTNTNGADSLSGSSSTTYYYTVTALNATGETTASSEASIQGSSFTPISAPTAPTVSTTTGGTLTSGTTYYYQVAATTANGTTVPTAPTTNYPVTTSGTDTISWTQVTGATGYTVYRSTDNATWSSYAIASGSTVSLTDDGSLTWTAGATLPTSNSATTNTNAANLSWTADPGAVSYNIYRSTTSGEETYLANVTTNSYTDTGNATTAQVAPSQSSAYADHFSSNGNVTIQSLNNSTTAFQVQDAGGTSILSVDAAKQRVSVGALGTQYGQLYVSGALPSTAAGTLSLGASIGSGYVIANGKYAFVPAYSSTSPYPYIIQAYDITNPASPVFISSLNTNGQGYQLNSWNVTTMALSGDYLYVGGISTSNMNVIEIFNVSDPSNISYVGTANTNSTFNSTTASISALVAKSDYIFVGISGGSSGQSYIDAFNVTNPANPVLIDNAAMPAHTTPHFEDNSLQGKYLYIASKPYTNAGSLLIYDISNPSNLVPVYNPGYNLDGNSREQIVVSGIYAYLYINSYQTPYQSYIQVFNVSNPLSPSLLTTFPTGYDGFGGELIVRGHYLYVDNSSTGNMQVIDVSNPSSPSSVGVVPTSLSPYYSIQGNYLYSVYNGNLEIFDLGGTYTQSLQSGSSETGSLQVDNNANISGAGSVQGSLKVGGNTYLQDNLSVGGQALFESQTNSTTAFQIQNTGGASLFAADTANLQVNTGGDLNVGTNFGQRLYSDNFESGSLALWTSSTSSGGTTTIDTAHAHDGKYAAKIAQGGGTAQIYANIAATGTVDFRGYFYMTATPASAVNIIKLYTTNTQSEHFSVYIDPTGYVCIYTPGSGLATCSTTTFPLNQWNEVSATVTAGISGSVTVTLNGTVISSLTKSGYDVTGGTSWVQVGSGNQTADTVSTATFWVDDISVDTASSGDGQSLNVSDSLHVSGNATFGNSVFLQTTSNSTTGFQIQNAAGTSIFTVDTANDQVVIGSGSNTITFNPSSGITASGTAQHLKTITLTPEYAGAVLDTGGSGSTSGTMTSGFDSTQRETYYNWTTTQTSAQTYDVVLTVALPSDWSSWSTSNSLTLQTWSDDTTRSTGTITVTGTTGTVDVNASSVTPGTNSTWATTSFNLTNADYAANGVVVIRIHMSSTANGATATNFRAGNLVLSYNSAF